MSSCKWWGQGIQQKLSLETSFLQNISLLSALSCVRWAYTPYLLGVFKRQWWIIGLRATMDKTMKLPSVFLLLPTISVDCYVLVSSAGSAQSGERNASQLLWLKAELRSPHHWTDCEASGSLTKQFRITWVSTTWAQKLYKEWLHSKRSIADLDQVCWLDSVSSLSKVLILHFPALKEAFGS